ncbi:MAG: PQQ-like beta-propeller repeat protein, partial [Thermomicrobiales bacterium]|nr:PQQ-like beta-propeller repeat protein [Thermomicrobiales bacterium]
MNDTQERFTTLDMALDQVQTGEASRPVPKREIAELLTAAREFGVVAASGGQEPHEDFVRRLEAQLASRPPARSVLHSQTLPEPRQPGIHGGGEHAVQWRHMRVFPLVAALLVIAMLLGAVAAITQMRSPDDFPTMIPAPVFAHPSGTSASEPDSGFLWERVVTTASDNVNMLDTAIAGNIVYWFRVDKDFNDVEAIDGRTGETLWRVPAYGYGRTMRADGYGVYYVGFSEVTTREGGGSLIVALSPQSGQERWRLEVERSRPADMSVDDGRLYIRHENGRLTAIDTEAGEILWTAGEGDDLAFCQVWAQQNGLPAILDDAIVTLDCDGALIGYDPDSGVELWRIGGFSPVATFLNPAGNTVVVMSAHRWNGMSEVPGSTSVTNMGAFSASRFAVYRIVAIDGADGQTLWERFAAARPQYQAATDSTFAVIGSEVPAAERDSAELPATPTPDFTGIVVAPGVENHVMGFDLRSGELLWEETLEDDAIYRTLSAWSTETGSGIAATTSNFDIIQVGPWEGGAVIDPGDRFLVVEPPLAGDFGFVAEAIDGRL